MEGISISLSQLATEAQKKYPGLSVISNALQGTVYIKGIPVFNTTGPATESVSRLTFRFINAERF